MLDLTFIIASFLGTIAFTISGFLQGVKKNLDLIGIFIVSLITANGGGIIRDVLVGRTPLILKNQEAFWITLIVMVLGIVLKLHERTNLERRFMFIISDSVGLVAFSMTGTLIGLEFGLGIWGVITLSFITAVGGGIIRDIIVNEVPQILGGGFYGTVAIVLAITVYLLHQTHYYNNFTALIVFSLALALRLVAFFKNWSIPGVKLR